MPNRAIPVLLAAIGVLTYGVFIPWLGYYDDDWPGVYNLSLGGLNWVIEYYSFDRPFGGVVMGAFHFVLGDKPLGWQISALVTRWFSAMAFWWLLTLIWPRRVKETSVIALLFLVYPGILQEFRAFTFGVFWLQLSFSLGSLALMLFAVQKNRFTVPLTLASMIIAIASWNINEYFLGLELLRPILLWYVINEKEIRHSIATTIKNWIPYLFIFIGFIVYRLFVFDTTREEVDPSVYLDKIWNGFPEEIFYMFGRALPDIIELVLLSWAQQMRPMMFEFSSPSVMIAWTIGIICGVGMYLFYSRQKELGSNRLEGQLAAEDDWSSALMKFGLITIICGMLLIWYAGLHYVVNEGYGPSRYALSGMIGASICLYGLIHWIVQRSKYRIVIASVLVGFGVATHIVASNSYRHEWLDQKDTLWQLSWRMPDLEPGTLIFLHYDGWPERHGAGYTMPLNLLYGREEKTTKLDYWVDRLDDDKLLQAQEGVQQGKTFNRGVRNLEFSGQLNNSLVVWRRDPGCVHVLTTELADRLDAPPLLHRAINLSRVSLIKNSQENEKLLPRAIFGPEPEHTWCYFYVKAELAQQYSDWLRIVELGNEINALGLTPKDRNEWYIFIDAYRKLGRLKDAELLSSQVGL